MVSIRQNVPLTETFTELSIGARYAGYQGITNGSSFGNVPGPGYSYGLSTQEHIDIRTFNASAVAHPEHWTASPAVTFTTGPQASINHWLGLNVTLPTGTTTLTSTAASVDLTQIPGGYITLALPSFPLASISTSGSSLKLSDGTNTATLPFGTSTTTIVSGNTTATWPISAVTGINLTMVTTVQLAIDATAACTFYAMALRLINPYWVPSNLDFDTWNGTLRPTIPLNGDPAYVPLSNQTLPTLWRTAPVAGLDDPRPINGEFGVLFNTGSQTKANSFTLYMREESEQAFITQIDLQGDTQASLTGRPQPTEGVSEYSPRTIGDLERYEMGGLNTQSMLNLERSNNPVYSSWINFTIGWGANAIIQINNSANATSNNPGYQYTPPTFTNNTTYLAIFNLTDTNAQVQIWAVDQTTLALLNPIFDSTVIPDSYTFPRRSGRVGFTATLADGDTYIQRISPRSLMFAEYKSKPLQSLTPVSGAQLYVFASPDTELFSGWTALTDQNGNTPLISVDTKRFAQADTIKQSTRVVINTPSTGAPAQGVISNWLSPSGDTTSGITDFDQLHLSFSLWVPSAAINSIGAPAITASLVSEAGNVIPLALPTLLPDQWTNVSLWRPVNPAYPISGLYQLALHYNGVVPATWWVDVDTMRESAIRWDARSVISDPWNSNYAPWTPFRDKINSAVDGVKFTTVGTNLQMRAQALKQTAVILSSPKLVPQYAELGRLVWPENALQNPVPPTPAMTVSNVGRAFTFNGLTTTSPNGMGDYYWVFGDGTYGSGPVITHNYPSWVASGTIYTASLAVVDRTGLAASSTPYTVTLP